MNRYTEMSPLALGAEGGTQGGASTPDATSLVA